MIKYPHIERLGTDEVDGILNGTIYIMPKIDGTNGQIYLNEYGALNCASRNKVLTYGNTNQGFFNHVFESDMLEKYTTYLTYHPHHVLYGEWLVPHTLKTYRKDAWRRFYIFDIFDNYSGMFIEYNKYMDNLREFGLAFIPIIGKVYNSNEDNIQQYLDRNTFLIEDGKGIGEGIVIKNYSFVNRYGRTTWAKLVRNEFKEQHIIAMGYPEDQLMPLELKIAIEFVTKGRLDKIKAKILTEKETGWSSKYIGEYLGRVWNEIIVDEMWNILKKYKNPKIDFKSFNQFVIQIVKEIDREVFGG